MSQENLASGSEAVNGLNASVSNTSLSSHNSSVVTGGSYFQPRIDPPGAIDLSSNKEENFRQFVSKWKTFSILTELDRRDQQYQTALLKYCVGAECVKVLEADASYDESKPVKHILEILEQFCIGDRNIIHERFVFNSISQAPHEPFDVFYSKLREHAKRCQYNAMTEDLIRDRIVLGVAEDSTRKKLIAYGNALNVDAAVRICRSQEVADNAMKDLCSASSSAKSVDVVTRHTNSKQFSASRKCGWCGNVFHSRDKCPARDVECRKCFKKGHFGKVCRSTQKNEPLRSVNDVQMLSTDHDGRQKYLQVRYILVRYKSPENGMLRYG